MREIKFKIIYGIEGKRDTYFSKVFTFDEIGNGEHFEVLSDNPFYKDYTIIDRLQYTGLKDKNKKELYEGGIVKGKDNGGDILTHIIKYQFGGFLPFAHYIEDCMVDELNCDLIGDIYENFNY